MALILPRSYHKIAAVERNRISWIEPELAERQDIRPLRIGILNIMPLGKQYEFNLLHPLGLSPLQIEPIWIRLNSHAYKTWNLAHLDQLYVSWQEAMSPSPLDGFAPITAAFESVVPLTTSTFDGKPSFLDCSLEIFERIEPLGITLGRALSQARLEKVFGQFCLFMSHPILRLFPSSPQCQLDINQPVIQSA